MAGDLLFKQLHAVIDKRTTVICLQANGQIRPVNEPYDTLNGSFDEPPFHVHCRSMSVPYMPGFVNDARKDANAEILTRPAKQRALIDGRVAAPHVPSPSPTSVRVKVEVKPLSSGRTLEGVAGHAELSRSYQRWLAENALDGDEEAFLRYTRTTAYQKWNPHMRGQVADVTDKDLAQIEKVRRLIEDAPPLQDDLRVLRGIADPEAVFGADSMASGTVLEDRAFISTTMDDEVMAYYKDKGFGGGAVLSIRVPAGTRVAVAESESQVILAPGTKMRVVSDRPVREIMLPADYEYLAKQGLSPAEFEEQLIRYHVVRDYRAIELEVVP